MTREVDPQTLVIQATYAADDYMEAGHKRIAKLFGVKLNSKEHHDLCVCLMPEYMRSCIVDFEIAMRATGGVK